MFETFSFEYKQSIGRWEKPVKSQVDFGLITPVLGRTQYFFGDVLSSPAKNVLNYLGILVSFSETKLLYFDLISINISICTAISLQINQHSHDHRRV
jgi:hypothetical protein